MDAAYNEECRSIVTRYTSEWETVVNRLGRWIDFHNDYKTMEPWFMESVWWVFKSVFDKGLVYRSYKVMPYSTACNTPLSNFEAGLDYRDVVDPAVTVTFPLEEDPEVNLLAWTTTPWTLPSNLALCVNEKMEYVKIRDAATGQIYVLAEARLTELYKKGTKAKGDYSNTALGGSIEVGKHVKLADGYFVEPFVQMSSVWIDGDSYTLDNGLQADTGRTQSVLGKIGSTVGRSFVLEDGGVVQPYVRAALAHEFSRNNEVKVNGQRFDNGLFGSRAELGAGVSVSLSERLQVHADFDYMKGEHVEQPWGANVGLRLAF